MNPSECQVYCLGTIAEGKPEQISRPFGKRLRLAVLSSLDPRMKRAAKNSLAQLPKLFSRFSGRTKAASTPATSATTDDLKSGDLVRVRTVEEIQATLDPWGQLKGCGFMPEMRQYCGTSQRVLKPMERFFDECDQRIRRCRGMVLLEGLMCQGVAASGRCDRSCFFFWREEWLEKID